ncbi:MAG: hypothetical protein AAFU60_05045, partial [Bacteroidota bacterium]
NSNGQPDWLLPDVEEEPVVSLLDSMSNFTIKEIDGFAKVISRHPKEEVLTKHLLHFILIEDDLSRLIG